MKENNSYFIPYPSSFQNGGYKSSVHKGLDLWVKISLAKGGISLNSPLERGPGVYFLLGMLFNHGPLAIFVDIFSV